MLRNALFLFSSLLLFAHTVFAFPRLLAAGGAPDYYFSGLLVPDRTTAIQTLEISPNNFNLLFVESVNVSHPNCPSPTSCRRLTISSSVPQYSRVSYVPAAYGDKYLIADDGNKIAIIGQGTGIYYSNDGGQSFQFEALQFIPNYPYLGCQGTSNIMDGVFGTDNKLYVDYMIRSLNAASQNAYCYLRRLTFDTAGVPTHTDLTPISPTTVSVGATWLRMTKTNSHIVTAVAGFQSYGSPAAYCYGIPGVVETPIATGVPRFMHVGAPCPTYGGPANYLIYGGRPYSPSGAFSNTQFRLTSDGANVFIANPVPPTGTQKRNWKIWKFPLQGGVYFPNTATGSTPPITDLSQLSTGTDMAAYMTMTQTANQAGLLRGIMAPWSATGGDRVRAYYLTPDQLPIYTNSNRQTMQFVDLVNPNAGAYTGVVDRAEDIDYSLFQALFPGGVYNLIGMNTTYFHNFGHHGGLLFSTFGLSVQIPGTTPLNLVLNVTDLG